MGRWRMPMRQDPRLSGPVALVHNGLTCLLPLRLFGNRTRSPDPRPRHNLAGFTCTRRVYSNVVKLMCGSRLKASPRLCELTRTFALTDDGQADPRPRVGPSRDACRRSGASAGHRGRLGSRTRGATTAARSAGASIAEFRVPCANPTRRRRPRATRPPYPRNRPTGTPPTAGDRYRCSS
jgi:hypothetical protein